MILFFTYDDGGASQKDLTVFSYTAGGYALLLVVFMIWSFVGLNRVIKHLFDGKLNAEFKLLRLTYFVLMVAFFMEAVYFSLYQLYYYIICSTF